MRKTLVSTLVWAAIFCFAAVNKQAAADCFPAPCDEVCPAPCDSVCQTNSFGSYLTEKSVFDSKLFENRLIGKKSKSRISFHGWVLTGITVNNYGATHTYGPTTADSVYGYNNRPGRPGYTDTSGNSYVLMMEQPTNWKLNQLWFGARRDLHDRFDWGFNADFVYGTDARYARNWSDESLDSKWGSGDNFAAMGQLAATVGTKDLFVKVGKFAGSFSYEGLPGPREYFYSNSHLCYGRALTTHGVVAEWSPNKKWTFSGGWLAGTFNSFSNPYGDSAFLGKATRRFSKDVSLSYHVYYNDRGARPGGNKDYIENHNILILRWQISPRWYYMGETAYMEGKALTSADTRVNSRSFGVNNHLIYTVNDKFSVGFRGEYHYSLGSTFDNRGITGGEGGDLWEFTFASQYKINPKTTLRPEIRYDYTDYNNGYRPFGGDASKNDQLSGGVSLVVTF